MSHLAEEYAKSCGVKIGKPVLNPHYFPVLHDKYITIHNDKKVQAKEYDMWPDVIELIRPFLGEIKIIQIGAFGEPTIFGVDDHIPTSSLKQSSYIIKNSLAHVGIDSVPVHIASAFDKPVVGIYAHTYANTCCPLWNDKSKFITIESDRGGNKPSFSLEEHPKTINFIKPEEIAQAVLDVLGIEEKINHKTIFIGNNYTSKFLEVIPTSEPRLMPSPIDVRMDIAHNEQNLSFIVRDYEVEVTLSKPIDKRFLACGRIKKIAYKSDRFDPEFCDLIKTHAIPHALICTSPETLSEEREKNFDLLINYLNEEEIILNNKKRIKVDDFSKVKIKSGKTIVVGQQAYETFFDLNDRKNLDHFYLDLDYFRVYTEEDE
jgi:hypothetical protein